MVRLVSHFLRDYVKAMHELKAGLIFHLGLIIVAIHSSLMLISANHLVAEEHMFAGDIIVLGLELVEQYHEHHAKIHRHIRRILA